MARIQQNTQLNVFIIAAYTSLVAQHISALHDFTVVNVWVWLHTTILVKLFTSVSVISSIIWYQPNDSEAGGQEK